MDYDDVIRTAVRASLATVGVAFAVLVFLSVCAAIISPSINLPGVEIPRSPSGD